MNKYVIVGLLLIVVFGCKQAKKELTANDIVDKAIEVTGDDRFKNSTIDFDFRNRHYKAIRNQGEFQYEREFQDSLGTIKDVLKNAGYNRFLNEEPFTVHDTMAVKYTSSVNSVHYFVVLPYGLNDDAVHKTYLDKVEIKGQEYHKIKVTFSEDGGGEDFEDVFVYWFNVNNFKLDYLAYLTYNSDRTIDLRFREGYNERYVNGIRFVDYNNYKPENMNVDLLSLDTMFENNELKLLSKIENKNISVR